MWPWRDWVVARLQRATCRSTASPSSRSPATCCPARRREQQLATGFHRNHPLNGEGGRVAEESRVDYVVDRVDTTGTVFLGLTVGCARCHDHKYDPLKTKEYYRLYAYFNSIAESGAVDRGGNAAPVMEMPTPGNRPPSGSSSRPTSTALNAKIAAAPERVRAEPAKGTEAAPGRARRVRARQSSTSMVMEDRPTPRESHVLVRGAWDAPGEKVTPGVVGVAGPGPQGAPPNRLALAKLARRCQQPADGPRPRQPLLATALRRGPGQDRRGFRRAGRGTEPPRTARLARGRVPRERLGSQAPAAADGHEPDLPPVVARRRRRSWSATRRTACWRVPRATGSPRRRSATRRSP